MVNFYKEEVDRFHELWQEAVESGDEKMISEHMNNYTNNQEIINL